MAHYIFACAPQQREYWAICTTFSSRLQVLSFPALKGRGLTRILVKGKVIQAE
jgi:hypothetical protein